MIMYWCRRCTIVYSNICPNCVDDRTGSSRHRNATAGSSFNPLIVLPGSGAHRRYDLYYKDKAGRSGFRPLPPTAAESILGSGLDSLLDFIWLRKGGAPPLPSVHVDDPNSVCAVCTDAFAPGAEALEMPCSHKYHSGCIFPWLCLHRSCPVCRKELPTGTDWVFGLALWKLPHRDELAVGRFEGVGDVKGPTMVYRIIDNINLGDGGEGESGIRWRRPPIRRRGGGSLRRFLGLGNFRRSRSLVNLNLD